MREERYGESLQDDDREAEKSSWIRVEESFEDAVRIVEEVMGGWHAYYAKHSASVGGRGLVVKIGGKIVGGVVYYEADLRDLSIGVVYYVAVKPEYGGRGLGKILVLSAEEMLNTNMYVATLQSANTRSRRLFSSLCYKTYTWNELSAISRRLAEAIYMATCSYEDDLVMVKGSIRGYTLGSRVLKIARRIWDKICYKPWLEYKAT